MFWWSASICVQLRVRGGFHAAADHLVPHTLHHLSQIIRDEERRGGNMEETGEGWGRGVGDECADLVVGGGWFCRAVGYMKRQDILEEADTGGKEAEKQD